MSLIYKHEGKPQQKPEIVGAKSDEFIQSESLTHEVSVICLNEEFYKYLSSTGSSVLLPYKLIFYHF